MSLFASTRDNSSIQVLISICTKQKRSIKLNKAKTLKQKARIPIYCSNRHLANFLGEHSKLLAAPVMDQDLLCEALYNTEQNDGFCQTALYNTYRNTLPTGKL
ncbi:uncharacterized protein RBU57_000259 [Macrochelys suwanniensis]